MECNTASKAGVGAWALPRMFAAVLACMSAGLTHVSQAQNSGADSAAALRDSYGALQHRLGNNSFHRPLHLDSSEAPGSVSGDIHALVNYPFATVSAALNNADNWCDIMILHLNTKYCRASTAGQINVINVSIGKKYDQPLNDTYRVAFVWRVTTQTPGYLQIKLNADEGPLSTRDYRIVLEAIPLQNGQTFMRFSYSYGFGMVGRLAMQGYLGTIGNSKVGFTVTGKKSDGEPIHIGGMRGLVERNTMRYYLAVEAFLGALSAPPQARLDKSLRDWFTFIERYPRQLHEMEQSDYLEMKRREVLRQQGRGAANVRYRTEPPATGVMMEAMHGKLV